jgi:hypothetical protein
MDELLANPAIQAGVAPFLAALLVAGALRRTRLLGFAITVGFAVVIALAIGFSFESMTSTRKLVLVGMAAGFAMLAIEAARVPSTPSVRMALAAAAAAGAIWVIWRVLQQKEAGVALLAGAAAALYLVALVESTNRNSEDGVRASVICLVLGLGAGALALLGASALLAQVGIAIGAAAGATLLVQMLMGQRAPGGWTLAYPAAVVSGLVCLLSVFTGALPWYCLLPTLAAPWAVRLVPAGERPVWLTSILTAVVALIPMLLAVSLAWFRAGAST